MWFLTVLVGGAVGIVFVAGWAVYLLVARRAEASSGQTLPSFDDRVGDTSLLFLDGQLLKTGARIGEFLDHAPKDISGITEAFETSGTDLKRLIDLLQRSGQSFINVQRTRKGDYCQITGSTIGAMTQLTIDPADNLSMKMIKAERRLAELELELSEKDMILQGIKSPAFILTSKAELEAANAAARAFLEDLSDQDREPVQSAIQSVAQDDPQQLSLHDSIEVEYLGKTRSFEVSVLRTDAGSAKCYVSVTENSALLEAQVAMNAMLSTLSDTFAHLSTGLAIFDDDRKLTMFNPALASLLDLDPVMMAARPGLREFFEALRRNRNVPEQVEFKTLRSKLLNLEAQAQDGQYHEDWMLASGRTLRVTGRPHVRGGLAFLFEDITNSLSLERKYRAELDLSKSVFDQLTDAVAVFNAAGHLILANTVFSEFWSIDPMDDLPALDITEVTRILQEQCLPNPAFGDLRSFATNPDNRAAWQANFQHHYGHDLIGHFAPLPDGTTLAVFSNQNEANSADRSTSLVVEQVIAALQSTRNALSKPSAGDADWWRDTLDALVEDLDVSLSLLRDRERERRDMSPSGIPRRLLAMMDERGIALSSSQLRSTLWKHQSVRQVVWASLIHALDITRKHSTIDLKLDKQADGIRLSLMLTPVKDWSQSEAEPTISKRLFDRSIECLAHDYQPPSIDQDGLLHIACTVRTAGAGQELLDPSEPLLTGQG